MISWDRRLQLEQLLTAKLMAELTQLADDVSEDELAEAIDNGDYAGVERLLLSGLLPILIAFFTNALRDAFEEAAADEAAEFDTHFDPLSPEAVTAIRSKAIEASHALLAAAAATILGILGRGARARHTAVHIARDLKSNLWLLDRHAAALATLELNLDENGVPTRQAEAAISRARYGYEKYRAKLLTVGLITAAIVTGAALIWLLSGALGEVEWITAKDEKVCPVCSPLNKVRIPLGAVWPYGDPPIHPLCRCDLEFHHL